MLESCHGNICVKQGFPWKRFTSTPRFPWQLLLHPRVLLVSVVACSLQPLYTRYWIQKCEIIKLQEHHTPTVIATVAKTSSPKMTTTFARFSTTYTGFINSGINLARWFTNVSNEFPALTSHFRSATHQRWPRACNGPGIAPI